MFQFYAGFSLCKSKERRCCFMLSYLLYPAVVLLCSNFENSEAAVGLGCCKPTVIPKWFVTGVLGLLVTAVSNELYTLYLFRPLDNASED